MLRRAVVRVAVPSRTVLRAGGAPRRALSSAGVVGTGPVWTDDTYPVPGCALPPLEPLPAATSADVCVIGLGGSGLSCVQEMVRRAPTAKIVGIDAGASVAAGAAGANGGFLLAGLAEFYHDVIPLVGRRRAQRIYHATLAELERMKEEHPHAVRLVGSLRVASDAAEEEDCRRQLAAMQADQLPVEWYEGPEGVGLLIPTDGGFHPMRRVRTILGRVRQSDAAKEGRVRLHTSTSVTSLEARADGVTVHTPRGRIECRSVAVCVDGLLDLLLPELAASNGGPVKTARLQMLTTAPTNEVALPRPVYSRYGFDYWQQLPDGRVALGGCRDKFEGAEWTTSTQVTSDIQHAMEQLLRTRVGVKTAPVTHRWAASVAYTTTGLPFLGEVRPNVWAAGAYSGTGNLIGALCGRALAAQLVANDPSGVHLFTQP